MQIFQSLLKANREKNNTSIALASSQLGIDESILAQLEESPLTEINLPQKVLYSYLRKYAESLEIERIQIDEAIIKIDRHYAKKNRTQNLTWFDYLNRVIILVLIIILAYFANSVFNQHKEANNKKPATTIMNKVSNQNSNQNLAPSSITTTNQEAEVKANTKTTTPSENKTENTLKTNINMQGNTQQATKSDATSSNNHGVEEDNDKIALPGQQNNNQTNAPINNKPSKANAS